MVAQERLFRPQGDGFGRDADDTSALHFCRMDQWFPPWRQQALTV
jgi:hypothetical protein